MLDILPYIFAASTSGMAIGMWAERRRARPNRLAMCQEVLRLSNAKPTLVVPDVHIFSGESALIEYDTENHVLKIDFQKPGAKTIWH